MAQAQQFETITMPEGGLGSFITSNMDEFDDNRIMFGREEGINSMKEVADRMASMGRNGDNYIIHATEQEVVVPRDVVENNPELVGQIKQAIAADGTDPERYVVGSKSNSINPYTGQPEFFKALKKLVKKVKNVFKKAAKIILPVAINYFLPGLGTIASGAIGAGVGGLIQGEKFGDALKSAALGGLTAGVASGISGAISGEGFMAGLKGGLPASYSGSGLKGAFPSAKDFTFRDFGADQGKLFGTGFRGTEEFAKRFPVPEAVQPLTSAGTAEQVSEIMANNPNISDKVALDIVQGNAAAGAGGSSFLKTAAQIGIPSLLAASSAGLLDPIPATEITEIAGTDITDMSDPSNPLADPIKIIEANPEDYLIGQPGNPNYITPTQAIYSGQPLTTAAYLPSQGTYNPIVPSATYSNITPTGAGTAPITPSGSSSSPEVAEVQLAGYDPRVTGMRPAKIYGVDAQGNPIMTPYVDPIMPARFVGSNQEVQMAASGGAMNFPRRTGQIEGPGTGTSDDIPAMLSDGEFVMTAQAVKNAGGGSREQGFRKMYDIMRSFEGGAVA